MISPQLESSQNTKTSTPNKKNGPRCLAGVHHCQAVHQKTKKLGWCACVAWQHGAHRQVVPQRNLENTKFWDASPGGLLVTARQFLGIFQNAIIQQERMIHAFHTISHTMIHENKH